MGKLDELKLKNICKKEGRMQEYIDYREEIIRINRDINLYSGYLSDATEKFQSIQQKFPENSKEYNNARDEFYRWKQTLEETKLKLKFVRPNSQQDIEYRKSLTKDFVDRLESVISPNLDLRFHGTPIYFAEQIIKTGTISSSADRYDGYIKSTDMEGEISVSNIKSLGTTINFFSDLFSYQSSMPAGCIFAIMPKDERDATYGHNLIKSIDFRKNPKQFFGIFTTPENVEKVKGWMKEVGFNSERVYTFEGFLEEVKSNCIDQQINSKNNIESANNISDKIDNSSENTTYLFGIEDARELAMEKGDSGRRIEKLTKLQEKIKYAIKQLKNKLKTKGEKKDEPDRD